MRINRDNYESFLVDYAEGNLSADLVQEVEAFLTENYDIKEEFDLFASSDSQTEEELFFDKNSLKAIPFDKADAKSDFFQEKCVAKIENLLTPIEEELFNKAIEKNKEKQTEYNWYTKTKLLLDNEITFNEKLILKREDYSHVITPTNFIEYGIACTEGWLSHSGMVALNSFIAGNKDYEKEYQLIQKIKLVPDFNIIYPNKSRLKKFQILHPDNIKKIAASVSVAAMLAIGYFLIDSPEIMNNVQTASTIGIENIAIENNKISSKATVTPSIVANIQKSENKNNKTTAAVYNVKKEQKSNVQSTTLEVIKPKTINNVECEKCITNYNLIKPTFEANVDASYTVNSEVTNQEIIKVPKPKTLASNLIKKGINKIEEVTNGKVKVNKNNSKSTIEINTKYLAFSTNLKQNKKY